MSYSKQKRSYPLSGIERAASRSRHWEQAALVAVFSLLVLSITYYLEVQ